MKRREFLAASLAAAASPAGAAGRPADPILLTNDQWKIEIDPRTLMIAATPAGAATVTVSRGVPAHKISGLETNTTSASWGWDETFHISCTLTGPDLDIRVSSSVPRELELLHQPGAAMGMLSGILP
jgi:hypothetical protein